MTLDIALRGSVQILIALIPVAVIITGTYGLALITKIIYKRFWHVNMNCTLQFSAKAAFEGEKIIITDILTNNKKLPLPWIHVSYKKSRFLVYPKDLNVDLSEERNYDSDFADEVVYLDDFSRELDHNERYSFVYFIGMKKTISRKSTVLCKKRGYYPITNITINSNNPLMTGFAGKEMDQKYGITVYPRLVEYPEAVFPFKRLMGDIITRRFTNPDLFTFKGIREYQPFDSFRQINFNATAKTGELMSNVYDYTISGNITVILNLQKYSITYNRDIVHESSIRLTAYLCRRFIEMGIPVSLVYPSSDGMPTRISSGLSKAHLYTIYTALAFVNLNADMVSASDYLVSERDNACIMISSFHGQDLYDKFISNERQNPGNKWVIPYYFGDKIEVSNSDCIMKWEVPHEDR